MGRPSVQPRKSYSREASACGSTPRTTSTRWREKLATNGQRDCMPRSSTRARKVSSIQAPDAVCPEGLSIQSGSLMRVGALSSAPKLIYDKISSVTGRAAR